MDLATRTEKRAELAQKLDSFKAINLVHVRAEIAEALAAFGRIGVLEEYTKHDISHIDGMLRMYDWLIPEESANRMTPADWLLITLATYLHDFGLLVTRDEFDARVRNAEFATFSRRVLDGDSAEFQDYRSQLAEMENGRDEEFLYQEFVRANHAHRIKNWLRETPDFSLGGDEAVVLAIRKIIDGVEESFLEDLGVVCESHHSDDLDNVKKYPLNRPYGPSRAEEANVQYAAVLLRTADLLHITRERVPSMAALVINPRNPKSQVEWAKQSAVRSVRSQPAVPSGEDEGPSLADTIEVHASFKEAEGFFGLTQYLKYAGRQVAQSRQWISDSAAEGYNFPWRRIDTTHIEAKGFVAEPFEFKIDQGKILDLLTGHTLYNDSGVVVRELLQNALDAVRLASADASVGFDQRIEVLWDSEAQTLEIRDNGVGMTQSVIDQNFLRVGSSIYQDPEFQKRHPHFASISRFGIGVLSAFMVADDVSVMTNSRQDPEARQLTLRDVHGQYLVRLVDKNSKTLPELMREHGTSVRLKLRPSAKLLNVESLLKYWVVLPGCSVTLSVNGGQSKQVGFSNLAEALRDSLLSSEVLRESGNELTTSFGDLVEIRDSKQDGFEIAYAVSWNRWLQEWRYIRLDRDPTDDDVVAAMMGVSIGGVRVTEVAPGFNKGGIAAMANVCGKSAPRTNVARSAIEQTEEYDNFLGMVYDVYVSHISAEMEQFENSRGGTSTRSALEGAFLLNDLALRSDLVSDTIFRATVRRSELLLVEQAGRRARRSLASVEDESSVWTVEGTVVESFETVLASMRGASSASLGGLIDALSVDDALNLPDGPLVSGKISAQPYNMRLFTAEWEPRAFETDEDSRVLRTRWERIGSSPAWLSVRQPRVDLPAPLQRLRSTRRGRLASPLLFAQGELVTSSGITGGIVLSQRRYHVLPENPLLNVPPVEASIPEDHRLWALAWILQNLVIAEGDPFGWSGSGAEDGPRDAAWRSAVVESVREVRLFETLDEAAFTSALGTDAVGVVDVHRWDRRATSE